MKVVTGTICISTKGNGDLIDITAKVRDIVRNSKLTAGTVTVFVKGSTAAITTFEYEPGLIKDVGELVERLIPADRDYRHNATWQDNNGHSHLRASLFGPSLAVPFTNGELFLGTWQQIVLAEFDTRKRSREILVQAIGE